MRFKQFLSQLQEGKFGPLQVGDKIFSKYEQYAFGDVEVAPGKIQTYNLQILEGEQFVVTDIKSDGNMNWVYFKKLDGNQIFHTTEQRIDTDFGRGTWKEWKKKWIKGLGESYDWMDANDIKIGGEYTKVDDVMVPIGHYNDWKNTYDRLRDSARVSMPIGTKVTVNDIIYDERHNEYIEFQTERGEQFFLADDAFCFNFFNGTYKEWKLRFFRDIGLPDDDEHLKEDGRFKKPIVFKAGEVFTVTKAQALNGEITANGKSIWFRAGNKLIVNNDIGDKVLVTTRQRSTRIAIPKADFVKYTVPEADYQGSQGYVKEDGPFKRTKQYKPLERGDELVAKKQFSAELDGKSVSITAKSKIRFVREADGKIIFKTTGRRYTTFSNENKFLTANKWDFLAACGEEVEGK
jgi:hypothetical protein